MPRNDNEPTSCFVKLQIKYKSVVKEVSGDEIVTTIIYQGTRELCEEAMQELKVNTNNPENGNLESVRMTQDEGPIWNLELRYAIENTTSKGSGYGPNKSELAVRMISMPLESKKEYRRKWNYHLYATKKGADTPDFWNSATYDNDGIQGTKYEYDGRQDMSGAPTFYSWGQSYSDCPTLPQGSIWYRIKKMRKPGVESFDYPSYELTERAKHTTQKQAGWAISKKAGKIANPENGDFGIAKKFGGDWLCEGGSIAWNGKYWESQVTYLFSPDGWDKDLYD